MIILIDVSCSLLKIITNELKISFLLILKILDNLEVLFAENYIFASPTLVEDIKNFICNASTEDANASNLRNEGVCLNTVLDIDYN